MTAEDAGFRERLTAYLDDELSPTEAREFLAALERDPEAMRRLEEARRVWALLGAYRDEPVPEGFAEAVLRRTVGGSSHQASEAPHAPGALRVLAGGRPRLALAAAAALVAALGAGAVLALRDGDGASGAGLAASSLATLESVPTGLLDSLDGESLARIASLSDDEFDALLAADPQDLADGGKRVESK